MINLTYIEHYQLDQWQCDHASIEDDTGDSYYVCPHCDYALDLIQIDEVNYVWCNNNCFKEEFNLKPLLLYIG